MRRVLPLLLLLPLALPAAGQSAEDPTTRAVAFLASHQGADGAVGDAWLSSWAALALAAARQDAHALSAGGASLAEYLAAHDAGVGPGPAPLEAARAVLTAVALGEDPRSFGGADRVARLLAHHDGHQFGAPTAVNDDVWGIFALRAAGFPAEEERIRSAATTLLAAQRPEGGWGIAAAAMPEADSTGWVLNALAEAGRTRERLDVQAIDRGLGYLAGLREPAGFRQCLAPGCAGPNAESTASVLAALHALVRAEEGAFSGTRAALLAFQREDGAFYRTATSTSWEFATPQALVALGGSYPPARRFDPQPLLTPASPVSGEEAHLSAAAARCIWEEEGRRSEGCRIGLAWAAPGAARVTLRAWSGQGGYARQTLEVQVRDAPPVALLVSPPHAPKHRPVALDGLGSRDAEGALVAWRFEFGDGTGTGWQASPLASHAYGNSGWHTVRLTVRDAAGQEAFAEQLLRVVNAAPFLSVVGPPACTSGQPLELLASAHDPDGDAIDVGWEMADGASTNPLRHSFPAGEWTVRAWARDSEGATAWRTVSLHCREGGGTTRIDPAAARAPAPVAPVLVVGLAPVVQAEEPFLLTGRVEDDGPGVRVQVALGSVVLEGEVTDGGFAARVPGLPAGQHRLLARAVDADGLASIPTEVEVTVRAAPLRGEEPVARPVPAAPLCALLAAWAAARLRTAGR